jgi:uncharacterized protein (DUF1800 family)
MMKGLNSGAAIVTGRQSYRTFATLLAMLLMCQPIVVSIAIGQTTNPRAGSKQSRMTEDQRIAHVLSRLTFGARPGDFERVKAMGVDAFIAQQLDPDALDDQTTLAKLGKLPTLGLAQPVIFEQYTPPKPTPSPSPKPADKAIAPAQNANAPIGAEKIARDKMTAMLAGENMKSAESMQKPAGVSQKEEGNKMPALPVATPKPTPTPKNPQMVVTELQRAALMRAVYSERQLYEVMVNFWENHFSIYSFKDDDRYLMTSYDRDTIRPFAMGRFRDLLGATAHSPAMLYYLDNWRSSVPRPYPAKDGKPAGVDGGINENYARELMELHTMGVDGGYTQKDVQEVARCFTGWTIQKPNEEGLFLYRPGLHDKGDKTVLGHKISAGGLADGERVLDLLATHPATARFIATKLARRFISDDPPPSVIDRAAAVFLKTDGSIRETLRAIITSPEFFSQAAYRAKVRSPFEYVAAGMRALGADTDIDPAVADWTRRMGQQVFGRITPDGYADRADQWLSSGAMVARFNFASALASNKIKGTKIDLARLVTDQSNKDVVAAQLMRLIVNGDASAATRAALEKTLRTEPAVTLAAPVASSPQNVAVGFPATGSAQQPAAPTVPAYITELVTLLIGAPEFQQR